MNKPIFARFPFYYGWVIVIVSFITLTVIYGIWWSFPTFYVNLLREFGWSRGRTATIFTVGSVVYGFGSLLAGALVDRFGPRKLLPVAGIFLASGCLLSSISTQSGQFYVAYGVFMGLGAICSGYVPITATVTHWFVRKRGTALGISLAGNVAPPLLAVPIQHLIFWVGWRAAYLVLAAVVLTVLVPLAAIFMRTRPQDLGLEPDGQGKEINHEAKPGKSRPGVKRTLQVVNKEWAETDWSLGKAVKTHQFWLLAGVTITSATGAGITMHHLVALVVDIGYSEAVAALIFSLAGFMAAIGRLGGFLCDRLGREITFTISASLFLLSALALLMVIRNAQIGPLYFYAFTFGLGSGLSSPSISSAAADLFGGKSFGAILGFANIGFGAGHGLGAWIGGIIFDRTGGYTFAILAAIPLFILMCLFLWLAGPRKVRRVRITA